MRVITLLPAATEIVAARDLQGIWADILRVGQALDLQDEAEELVIGLRSRVARLRAAASAEQQRVLCIEWLDPLYLAGHWVPELVAAAGGHDVGAQPGSHSARRRWSEVSDLRQIPVSIVDGNAYTSRPGPRVVDGAQQIQWALASQSRYPQRWQRQLH